MVYKRYIYRDGKKFGPYYYESYRDKHGIARTKYVPEQHENRAVIKHTPNKRSFRGHSLVFVLLAAMLLIILGIIFLNYQFSQSGEGGVEQKSFTFKGLVKGVYSFVTGRAAEETVETPVEQPTEQEAAPEETSPEAPVEQATEQPEETPAETETQEENITEPENVTEEPIQGATNETISEQGNESITDETQKNVTEEANQTQGVNGTSGQEEPEGGGFLGNQTQNFTISNKTFENFTISNETIANITNETLMNETLINETIINVTSNISTLETTRQYGAVLGIPVKWEKNVKVFVEGNESAKGLKIDLPEIAKNVTVKKLSKGAEEQINAYVQGQNNEEQQTSEENKSPLTGIFNFFIGLIRGVMTGRAVETPTENVSVEINEPLLDNDEILVEYYTDAPYSIENDLSNGKEVKIIGPEQVHYENVLVFTNLNENLNVKNKGSVTIYWKENDIYIAPESVEDLDENGIYDYVSWIVPHLSNQTFTIIVITKAEHLDENRTFISDIFEQVKELDNNWSEEISSGHYVRVTFEENLTSSNDITLYPRIVNGTPKIEVYEVNGDEIIAEFSNLSDNEYNKVFLTGLNESQDTFDLRVLDGIIEIDYIVDPVEGYFFEDCDDISDWTLFLSEWTSIAGTCRSTGIIDGTMTSGNIDLSASNITYANLSFTYDNTGLDAGVDYLKVYVKNSTSSFTQVFFTESNDPLSADINISAYIKLDNSVQIRGVCYSGFRELCMWDSINITAYTQIPDNAPTTYLVSPETGTTDTDGNMTFVCNATDDNQLENISLYTNTTGPWALNQTRYTGETQANKSSLVALLHLNNNVNDDSGYGNDGIIYGTLNYINGMFYQGLNFTDNANNYFNISDQPYFSPANNNFTILAWVKSYDTTTRNIIVKGGNGGSNWEWILQQENLGSGMYSRFVLLNLGGTVRCGANSPVGSMVANQWYLIGGTYNGTHCLAFVNTTSGIFTRTTADLGDGTSPIYFGKRGDAVGNEYLGAIDEVSIYNRSLSNTEVSNIFNYGKTFYNASFSLNNIADGGYIWNCQGTDNSSNSAFADANWTFKVDKTNPIASFGTNPVDTYNDTDGSITFDYKCLDNVGPNGLQIWGNWSGSWQLEYGFGGALNDTWYNETISDIPDGTWKWGVWCNDYAGNEDWSDTNRTFNVDSTNPIATMGTNPVDNYNSTNGSVTFDFKCSDNKNVSAIQLWSNWTGTWSLNYTNSSYTNNTWLNITISNIPDAGTYKWGVYCNDSFGSSNWTTNRTLNVDICDVTQVSSSTTLTKGECEHYNITADNVVFDCGSNTIHGNNSATYWGIEATNRDNITIKNCNFQKYAKVILLNNTINSNISNNTLYNNSHLSTSVTTYGMYLKNSNNTNVEYNNITKLWSNSTSTASCYSGTVYALYIDSSNNLTYTNNSMSDLNGQYYADTNPEIGGCQGGYFWTGYGVVVDNKGNSFNLSFLISNFTDITDYGIVMLDGENVFINDSNFVDTGLSSVYIAGTDGNINLYRNKINYSTGYGIYVSNVLSDKLVIKNNELHHGSSGGIYIGNEVTNGVEIIENKLSNFSDDYIYSDSNNANISNNVLESSGSGFGSNDAGIKIGIGSGAGTIIQNNTIFNIYGANSYGFYLSGSVGNITSNNITTCTYGIYFFGVDNINVWHSTITNSTSADFRDNSADNIKLYNVSFNKSKVDFVSDGDGSLQVYHSYRTNVTNQNLDAVQSALVNITDTHGTMIATNDETDINGLTAATWIMEYNQTGDALYSSGCTGSGSYINCSTPHNVTAFKTGYLTNSTNITIDQNKIGHVIIQTPIILAYYPTTDSFSIAEPSNQTFSIVTYLNETPITIKWFVNGSEQTSEINSTQFIWQGNYSQEGTWEIKVNISNEVGEDEQIWIMKVNDTPQSINLDLLYPIGDINVSQYSFFNVTLNVTCVGEDDCGTINVSLFYNNTLVNATAGASPFYTNATTNPQTTSSLNVSDTETITFWVNATGEADSTYEFFAYANTTGYPSVSNVTKPWNVTIISQEVAIAIDLSPRLLQPINWSLSSLPAYNQSAGGNNGSEVTEYYVNISVTGGTADLYVNANDDLKTSGGDVLGLGNETYSYNSTNSSVPSNTKISLTTNYSNNKIGEGLTDGNIVYLKFFLNAPSGQAAGAYNNSLSFKAVAHGQSP